MKESHQVLKLLADYHHAEPELLVLIARKLNHFQSVRIILNQNLDQDKARELAELFQSVMVPMELQRRTAGHLKVLYRDMRDNH